MEPERWKQIETVVAAAMDLDGEEREAYLGEALRDKPELRSEVLDLLARRTAASKLLPDTEPMPGIDHEALGVADANALIDSEIGPYRLTRLIGRGGMGVVYEAVRSDGEFHQKVALKLLHPGLASDELERRFRTERQILAVLNHPRIAHILDGGTTPDGRPYLVMEHVEATPLDQYCDENGLDVRQRIELFLQVCDAVSFAHRHMVIHRDLKPGNILVTADGEPKLLDFGIAKLLDSSMVPQASETRTGMRAMSPAFASPEQIRGEPVNTTSDVYSLGVVLYKLLTGELPRRFTELTPLAMDRELRRTPKCPSASISDTRDGAAAVRRRLRGDLDAIVLKALRDEPGGRYRSVDELADDLYFHLQGLPVKARRGTLLYRAGRFLRRHAAAAAVVAVILALGAGWTVTLMERNRQVVLERDKANEVATFMGNLFLAASPMEGGGPDVTAREVLDQGVENVRTQLADQPDLQGEMLEVLGKTYFQIGLYQKATDLLMECIDTFERAGKPLSPSVAVALVNLASFQLDGGDLEATEELVNRALDIARMDESDEPYLLPECIALKAEIANMRSDYDKGVSLHREAVEIARNTLGESDPYVAYRMIYLAGTLRRTGSIEAEEIYLRALEIQREVLEADDPQIMMTLIALGDYFKSRYEPSRALAFYTDALVIGEPKLGADHPEIGGINTRMSIVHRRRGELAAAATEALRALRIIEAHYPENAFVVLRPKGILADDLRARGDLTAARTEWESIYSLLDSGNGPQYNQTIFARQKLALVLHATGEVDLAERHMREALATIEMAFAPDLPYRAEGLSRAAELSIRQSSWIEAEERLRAALEIWEVKELDHTSRFAGASLELALALAHSGQTDEAHLWWNRAVKILESQGEDDLCPRLFELQARSHLAAAELRKVEGDPEAAANEWDSAIRLLDTIPKELVTADHHRMAAEALIALGRTDDARPHARILIDRGWLWPEWLSQFEG